MQLLLAVVLLIFGEEVGEKSFCKALLVMGVVEWALVLFLSVATCHTNIAYKVQTVAEKT